MDRDFVFCECIFFFDLFKLGVCPIDIFSTNKSDVGIESREL